MKVNRYGKQSLDKLEIHIPLQVAICNHMLLCSMLCLFFAGIFCHDHFDIIIKTCKPLIEKCPEQ